MPNVFETVAMKANFTHQPQKRGLNCFSYKGMLVNHYYNQWAGQKN